MVLVLVVGVNREIYIGNFYAENKTKSSLRQGIFVGKDK